MEKFSYLKSTNAAYIDELHSLYSQNPDAVDPSWRYFFEGLELNPPAVSEATQPITVSVATHLPTTRPATTAGSQINPELESKVIELIAAYRAYGKRIAQIDPLTPAPISHPLLELSRFGITPADLNQPVQAGERLGLEPSTLGRWPSVNELLVLLKQTYCGSIAVEVSHIENLEEKAWLQKKVETHFNQKKLSPDTQKLILRRLAESETFERFLHTRYVAQKRFSIEGAESLIPSLDCMIQVGAELGAEEFVFGMAHRGRLNVLTNLLGKKPEMIFTEFEGSYKVDTERGEGDVKYHMGFSADVTTLNGKKIHLSLASNPSHLEFVNPVIEGMCRAKQIQRQDSEQSKVIPIAIHGDAAFAGQGVCYETLNLSQLKGYKTGGTLHVVINNQVGFTTSPGDGRSTPYCTDLAKMLEVPIFHVNGDDPEALWRVSQLCVEYRQKFKKDVFIDLVCYRKHGHNEGDEPSFTQPLLYKKIKAHASPREIYAARLIQAGVMTQEESQQQVDGIIQKLTEAQVRTRAEAPQPLISAFEGPWKNFIFPQATDLLKPIPTAISDAKLRELSQKLNSIPSGFHLHPKLPRFFEARQKAVDDGKGIDWGNGELLAYASLLVEGHPVRLSGQDVERGTFTHRHSVLNDFETGEKYTPLNHLQDGQCQYEAHNSLLSETAVMGFEYGYSLADPNSLVIWEAQFGDFANGAQVIIDQFLASSESKWQRSSGLTLLLPHGFEGQGPEHSSARMERFLSLCGKNNLIICNLTTPAQLFHGLRRQMKRNFRKPLVIFSPKSMLRNPQAVSTVQDFTSGSFEEVLDDPTLKAQDLTQAIRKVLLCSGKIYYDLMAERAHQKKTDLAIIRVEQLYPWPGDHLAQILKRYPKANTLRWVQEEPRNMGAWSTVSTIWNGGFDRFQDQVGGRTITYVGRDFGAAPAVGSHHLHETEQEALIQKALL